MPPGFAHQCPYGLETAVAPWVAALWVIVYALCVETALLGLGLLALRLRRGGIASQTTAALLLLVTGCALGALVVAVWTTNSDLSLCLTPPSFAHVTLAQATQAQRLDAERLAQTHTALGAQAALVVLGTALTAAALVRGWRGRTHGSGTARA